MKVILVNGSPHTQGSTYAALQQVEQALQAEGIETEIFQLGAKPISGCIDCGQCRQLKKCVMQDSVNDFVQLARQADGFVFGSPVHFASADGAITSFMDRVFYSCSRADVPPFRLKPGAAIVVARRGGTTATLDQLNKYFTISEMPVISSRYWNMVHGNDAQEVQQDEEGMMIMRTLGRNMAWFLKCKQAAEKAGIKQPEKEAGVKTNFIR